MKIYSKWLHLSGAFFILGLASCASQPRRPLAGMQVLSPGALRLPVPFEAQTAPDLCGLACVDMLTNYYQKPLSTAALDALRGEAGATRAITAASLKQALEQAGYYVAVFAGTTDHEESGLYHHLDLKRPLIVMTGSGIRHYTVAVGYDETRGLIALLDPALGPWTEPLADFMKEWQESNYFTLLATPGT